jgi:hypothetical protein
MTDALKSVFGKKITVQNLKSLGAPGKFKTPAYNALT